MSLEILTEFEDYLKARTEGDLTSGYRVQYSLWQDEPAAGETSTDNTQFMVLKMNGGAKPDLDFFNPYVQIFLAGKPQDNGTALEQTIDDIMSYMQTSYNTSKFAIIEPIGSPTPVVLTTENRPTVSLTVRLINQM